MRFSPRLFNQRPIEKYQKSQTTIEQLLLAENEKDRIVKNLIARESLMLMVTEACHAF